MRKCFTALALIVFAGCGWFPGPGPPEPPEPTPPPVPVTFFTDMLLRTNGTSFVNLKGEPVEFRGAISCCMPNDDWGGSTSGWPVNFSPEWQEYAATKFNANFFHGRLGPFLKGGTAFDNPWSTTGGPYLTVSGERVDLTKWNPGYWNLIKDWVHYAGERGRYVEIDIIDGWYCKHGNWGDVKMPWMSEYNIQGQNHVANCSSVEILPGSLFDNWIRKVVEEFGPYGNVIWQDGNEIGITGQYTPEWTLSMQARVRHWEAEVAHNMVHIFATNSNHPTAEGQVDYVERHQRVPLSAPVAGRPSLVNEYNPKPVFSPETMNAFRCLAEQAGTFWWYWRHGQSLEQMEATAAMFIQSCPTDPPEPPEPPPTKCPKGQAQARTYWYQGGGADDVCRTTGRCVADATPAVCRANYTPPCYAGRVCHPVACEGDPNRLPCEKELMGCDKPQWILNVQSGNLSLVPDNWFGVVKGSGTGELYWRFCNGRATSKKLKINKP